MDLRTLKSAPEGKTLEFKRDASSAGPILRTVCAFANTAGGRLPEFKFEVHRFAFLSDFLRSCIALLRGLVAEPLART